MVGVPASTALDNPLLRRRDSIPGLSLAKGGRQIAPSALKYKGRRGPDGEVRIAQPSDFCISDQGFDLNSNTITIAEMRPW